MRVKNFKAQRSLSVIGIAAIVKTPLKGRSFLYKNDEKVFAHAKCVKNELKKINSILADEVEERLWESLTDAEKI